LSESKIEVLDFAIAVIREHEKELTKLEYKFEKIADKFAKILDKFDELTKAMEILYELLGK